MANPLWPNRLRDFMNIWNTVVKNYLTYFQISLNHYVQEIILYCEKCIMRQLKHQTRQNVLSEWLSQGEFAENRDRVQQQGKKDKTNVIQISSISKNGAINIISGSIVVADSQHLWLLLQGRMINNPKTLLMHFWVVSLNLLYWLFLFWILRGI